jgi:hypothetical protein
MEDKAMGKLLKLVFFRLRKEKAPMIEAFIAIGYALLMVLIYYVVYQAETANGSSGSDLGISVRTLLLSTISPGYNIPAVLIVAGIASFFYTELNYGTLRNQIVSGYSRKEIYTAYWIGMQIYMVIMLAIYAMATGILASALQLPGDFSSSNIGPFFLSLALGILYEMGIASLAFFLIILIKFPAWPIVIIVISSVASMIISAMIMAQNMSSTTDNPYIFYFLIWMPDIQAATLKNGDLSVIAYSLSTFGAGNLYTSKNVLPDTDFTAYSVSVIIGENILFTLASFLGGFFYFNHHDLK